MPHDDDIPLVVSYDEDEIPSVIPHDGDCERGQQWYDPLLARTVPRERCFCHLRRAQASRKKAEAPVHFSWLHGPMDSEAAS